MLINYSAPAACGGVKFVLMEFDITSQKTLSTEFKAEYEEGNHAEIHEEDGLRSRSSGGGVG